MGPSSDCMTDNPFRAMSLCRFLWIAFNFLSVGRTTMNELVAPTRGKWEEIFQQAQTAIPTTRPYPNSAQ